MASPADQPPDERRPSPRCRKTPQPDTVAVSTARGYTRWSKPVTIAPMGPLSPGRAAAGTPASVTTGPRPWGKTRVPGGSGEKTDEARSPTPDAISPCHTDATPGFRESPVGVTDWALHRMDKRTCSYPERACRRGTSALQPAGTLSSSLPAAALSLPQGERLLRLTKPDPVGVGVTERLTWV